MKNTSSTRVPPVVSILQHVRADTANCHKPPAPHAHAHKRTVGRRMQWTRTFGSLPKRMYTTRRQCVSLSLSLWAVHSTCIASFSYYDRTPAIIRYFHARLSAYAYICKAPPFLRFASASTAHRYPFGLSSFVNSASCFRCTGFCREWGGMKLSSDNIYIHRKGYALIVLIRICSIWFVPFRANGLFSLYVVVISLMRICRQMYWMSYGKFGFRNLVQTRRFRFSRHLW